ncbi:DUF4268 domain-containing protein [Thiohalocapsa marina]|uniref:DUF4268 domain-containing protein n=1 Tax=Thiohalocapsa marina TaxID=424902 RepID=A0A5M8FFS4_9GAMM|nr:DUF4268 domain-containing protein [Thiohalocapsa marina]KAA6183723.1 DUF4268 domain-containing protein [Thiohalocapsa marina]
MNSYTSEPLRAIDGRARTIRELLDKAKYAIDFYQREYAWQERQVRELIDDLTGKFLDYYEDGHARHEVERYGHYFLGSVVLSHKRGQRFVVDGQQRLTTLSLLLIYLHNLQADRDEQVDVRTLIYSEKFGRKSFNLDVPDRAEVMQTLLEGRMPELTGEGESVRNVAARYANIVDHFPGEIAAEPLPYFIDWLLENVHLVAIEAYSDEDAYTIFETMNDRGLSLSLPEMLKGYVLANITHEDDQRAVNATWKAKMQALREVGDEEDVDFFKDWLRARHAQTIRPGKRGAENKDFERIGSEFHRWVRDQKDQLGLADEKGFIRFVKGDLDFYARRYGEIRRAAGTLTPGWESIRYNAERGFTLQTQAILAPLAPDDPPEAVRRKVALVADFLDIWLARRVWSFRTIAYSSVRYTLFQLTKELRHRNVAALSEYLRDQLDAQPESFAGEPRFRLHQQNYRQVRHILVRLTHWVDSQCGVASHFEDLISEGRGRPFEIEHIWADQYERFTQWFPHPSDFETERNRIGGLVLLQRGINQSLGDAVYEQKRDAYATHSANLLARSLHPLAYQNNPAFSALIDRTGLPFRAYDAFGPDEQQERLELYIRIAEWVWNPSRLDLDGEKPPEPLPIGVPVDRDDDAGNQALMGRHKARLAFWTQLLDAAKVRSDLHARISPGKQSWLCAKRDGVSWCYAVQEDQTSAALYLEFPEASENKAVFDALLDRKQQIETKLGEPLNWYRLDDKKSCWIGVNYPGGWRVESTWAAAIEQSVEAMCRLYSILAPLVRELRTER